MILSIVTGTYNRLSLLQRMMESVRAQMPRHIAYEFVVVDAGSGDGTATWLESQPDVKLIQHGNLLGAIKAFCDGAMASSGEYVIMANDDVAFRPYSILRALAHLEEHPACGAVAFADDRASQLGHGRGYQVLPMPARHVDGRKGTAPYAQVGMFRRWLGDMVGWWGADDDIMSRARTYGGDNFLSARIWELGYSVDPVPGCEVDDVIARDGMRTVNNYSGSADSRMFYLRFPNGPQLATAPSVPSLQPERMRILALPIYEPSFSARKNLEYGLSEAFAAVGLTWEIDYVNEPFDLVAAVMAWRPHLLFTQIHAADGRVTPATLRAARDANPGMVIINWNGDAHESGLITPDIMAVLREVDVQLVINAKVLPAYAQAGIRADYWQIGYKDPVGPLPVVPQHDVVCLMNCYNDFRSEMAARLKGMSFNVGLYGSCPDSDGNTHYSFAAGRALYQNAKIAVGDTFPDTEGFVSNRLFQALAAGAFMLQQHSPKLDEWTGLVPGEHYVEWNDLDELERLVTAWAQPECEGERRRIAEAGKAFVRANFSYNEQVRKLWGLI